MLLATLCTDADAVRGSAHETTPGPPAVPRGRAGTPAEPMPLDNGALINN